MCRVNAVELDRIEVPGCLEFGVLSMVGVLLGAVLFCQSGRAANLTTTATQGTGSDWSEAIWLDGTGNLVSPLPGNSYELVSNGTAIGNGQSNTRVRSVIGGVNATNTFPGDSLKLNSNTVLRMKGNGIAQTLNFQGVNGNPGLILCGGLLNIGDHSVINILGKIESVYGTESYICPGNSDIGGFQAGRQGVFAGQISGCGTLVLLEAPTNTPTIISGNFNTFSGKWVVKSGYLLASGTNALGANSAILVNPNYTLPANLIDTTVINQAVLEVTTDVNSAGTLTLANGGQMNLHQNCIFSAITIGGVALSAGMHPYSELVGYYPGSFLPGGSGSLTIQPYVPPSPTAPTITAQPLPQTPLAGGTAIFSVTAAGTVPLFYQWRKSGVDLTDGGGISGSLNSSLTISNVSVADVAGYNVVVSNAIGSVTSSVVALNLQPPVAPAITTQPVSKAAFAGETVTFTVGVTGSLPLSYTWRKDGVYLADGGNISGSTLTNLTLRNVSVQDAARYDVVVSNAASAVTSGVAVLTLLTNNSAFQATQIQYLSGTDKDHTVPWNFTVSSGRNSGVATTIPVPSCWESMGFGTYQYGNNGSSIDGETGTYTYTFGVPSSWGGERIFLVFEGVFTDTSVTINGQSVGGTHQGGFYEFKYDVTSFVVVGANTNVLKVVARRWSNNASIATAEGKGDFWNFGGIFRPVYLQAVPQAFIDRIAVNPQANGQITVNAYLGGVISQGCTVNACVTDTNNVQLGGLFSSPVAAGVTNVFLSASLPTPNPWTAETPTLYTLTVSLFDSNNVLLHTVTNLIGFRTITFVNNQGFFVNGKKVVLRGVCLHEEWPTTGRTSSRGQADLDLALIRDMNFNTVRMTHYPPSKVLLEECDRLGFYVLDELTGWQAAYDNTVAPALVKELVIRDVNHPCIIAWDNGNEGGWNTTVDNNGAGSTNVYAIWDPQNRKVLRPGNNAVFSNVMGQHYPNYGSFVGLLGAGKTAYIVTEVIHGLYDGGGGASLQEFWDAMRVASNGIGMFLWVFADSGLVRLDQGGIIDVKGQNGPDGVVGPYREKEASYYSYKAIYSPVQIGAPNPASFTGSLSISNRFDFTDLNQCTFKWQLGSFPDAGDSTNAFSTNALTGGFFVSLESGNFAGSSVPPQSTGSLNLPSFPSGWSNYDALRLTANDPYGNNIYTWTWRLRSPGQISSRILGTAGAGISAISAWTNASEIILTNGPRVFRFARNSGVINSLSISNKTVSLNNGPRPADGSAWAVTSSTNYSDGTNFIVLVNNLTNAANGFQWTLRPDGWLKLNYRYTMTGAQNSIGITFDYPNNNVTGMSWLGQGPYRVYKNRLAGQEVFAHTKSYNDVWTGQSTNYSASHGTATKTQWIYPEFKGYHGQVNWATLQTTEQPITVVTPMTNLFFRVLTPATTDQANVNFAYPAGDLSFLHAINAIGDKFHLAKDQGPAGQTNTASGLYTGEINFFFGSLPPLPAVPGGVKVSPKSSRVVVSWTTVPEATGYNVKSATNSGGPYSIIASNFTSLVFTNSGLSNGVTYFYVVTAVNANGESKTSTQVSATPLSSPVIGRVSSQGPNIIIAGSNGTMGMSSLLLMTTNLLLPLKGWSVVSTNVFDSNGLFSTTNPMSQSGSNQFFMIGGI